MNDKKTIFITGSSSGLGRAAAKLFSTRGWNVIATMRNLKKAPELDNLDGVMKYSLDVTQPEEVKAAAEEFGAGSTCCAQQRGLWSCWAA
jgi:NAD(P)-dependent dehydrogenase (short-subunit alcohol dehydrogenase family)